MDARDKRHRRSGEPTIRFTGDDCDDLLADVFGVLIGFAVRVDGHDVVLHGATIEGLIVRPIDDNWEPDRPGAHDRLARRHRRRGLLTSPR